MGLARKIESTQRAGTLAITGAMRTTPTDSLDVHANLLPAHILFQQILFRSALRLSGLPSTHPLVPHIKKIEKKDMKKHCSALHKLIHMLGMSPQLNETILTHTVKPNVTSLFKTFISDNKKESIADFTQLSNRTLVFTDGSCTNGLIGASAVLYVDYNHIATLRYHLGSAEHHTVFKAEAVGLILAAHLLSMKNEATFPASILADNQAIIRSSENPTAKPGHYLLLRFRNTIRWLQNKKDIGKEEVMVRWIAGHEDVEGNEVADREAKLVAKGEAESSPRNNLPASLRNPLPHSISALKQAHNERLKKLWRKEWTSSPHFHHMSSIDPSLPSKSFMKLIGGLQKRQAGLYTQLRTGHAPLNKHLHRFKRSDTPNCLQCGDTTPETVHHFLFTCPRYDREKFIMERDVGRKVYHTAYLLSNANAKTRLLRYINETK